MLVHIEIKEIERVLFFIPSNHKGIPKRKKGVVLWRGNYPSNVTAFLNSVRSFLRNLKKVY